MNTDKKEKVPENVYFSQERCNFYDKDTNKGMGNTFYYKWFTRRNEFTQRGVYK